MRFVLLDETAGATTADGASLTPTILASIAAACTVQLNRDVSAEWGGNYEVRAGGGAGDIQPGEIVFAILPTLPNAPGAIAYHDSDGNGVPVLFDAITLSDTLIGPGNSLSVAISHELCETVGDEGCNDWCDDGAGNSFAKELCDAVEAGSYQLDATGVYVSNFLLKAFFVPGRKGPYDFMSAAGLASTGPSKPFATAAGGYQIARSAGTGERQVWGRFFSPSSSQIFNDEPYSGTRAARRTPKRHLSTSRQSRRGLKV
jgi:hypothetical protein